jgi:osmoprotectant transport system permease protein
VRVAVVITIGVAIIAAEVGAGGLGEYIFRGLRVNDNNLLLAGAVPSAAMALLADFGFGLIEKRFDTSIPRRRRSKRAVIALAALITLALIGFGSWRLLRNRSTSSASNGHVTVGSKDFTESILLAEIVAQRLESFGIDVDRRFDLGGNLAHTALLGNQIDLYPEYTGTALTAILHHQPGGTAKAVYNQVKSEYEQQFNLWVSPPLGFDNTFAILVRGDDARRLNLKTVSDVAKYSGQWHAGFGHDFMVRPDGYDGFSRAYGLRFAGVSDMSLDLTYTALASRKVDMIAGNSTDGRIASLDLVQLEDDRHYFPPYEGVFVARPQALGLDGNSAGKTVNILRDTLESLAGAISTDEMRKLNYEVDGAKRDKKIVVHEWLVKKGFVK